MLYFKFFTLKVLFFLLGFLSLLCKEAYTQKFETVYVFSLLNKVSKVTVHDFFVRENNTFIVLYDDNKELYVLDSEKGNNPYKLNARLKSEKGDKYAESKSQFVKQPQIYNNGKLVIAASDQDYDQMGGRFVRWDIGKNSKLDDIITNHDGIGKCAISNDGRYFVNYYYTKPGRKIQVIDEVRSKRYSLKTKQILYADTIIFTKNNSHLIFKGSLKDDKFINKVYSIPGFKQIHEPEKEQELIPYFNNTLSNNIIFSKELGYGIIGIVNNHLLIDKDNEFKEVDLGGTIKLAFQNKNDEENVKVFILMLSNNQISILKIIAD